MLTPELEAHRAYLAQAVGEIRAAFADGNCAERVSDVLRRMRDDGYRAEARLIVVTLSDILERE